MRSIRRLLQKYHNDDALPVRAALAKWGVLKDKFIPMINEYQDDHDFLYTMGKIIIFMTTLPPGATTPSTLLSAPNSDNKKRRVRYVMQHLDVSSTLRTICLYISRLSYTTSHMQVLRTIKHNLLKNCPTFVPTYLSILAPALDPNIPTKSEEHVQTCDLVFTLFKQLMEIPNPNHSNLERTVGNEFSRSQFETMHSTLHEEFISSLYYGGAFHVAVDITCLLERREFQKLNLLFLEFWWSLFKHVPSSENLLKYRARQELIVLEYELETKLGPLKAPMFCPPLNTTSAMSSSSTSTSSSDAPSSQIFSPLSSRSSNNAIDPLTIGRKIEKQALLAARAPRMATNLARLGNPVMEVRSMGKMTMMYGLEQNASIYSSNRLMNIAPKAQRGRKKNDLPIQTVEIDGGAMTSSGIIASANQSSGSLVSQAITTGIAAAKAASQKQKHDRIASRLYSLLRGGTSPEDALSLSVSDLMPGSFRSHTPIHGEEASLSSMSDPSLSRYEETKDFRSVAEEVLCQMVHVLLTPQELREGNRGDSEDVEDVDRTDDAMSSESGSKISSSTLKNSDAELEAQPIIPFVSLIDSVKQLLVREADALLPADSLKYFQLLSIFFGANRAKVDSFLKGARSLLSAHKKRLQQASKDEATATDVLKLLKTLEEYPVPKFNAEVLLVSLDNWSVHHAVNHCLTFMEASNWPALAVAGAFFKELVSTVALMVFDGDEETMEIGNKLWQQLFSEREISDLVPKIMRLYKPTLFPPSFLFHIAEGAHYLMRMAEKAAEAGIRGNQIRRKHSSSDQSNREKATFNAEVYFYDYVHPVIIELYTYLFSSYATNSPKTNYFLLTFFNRIAKMENSQAGYNVFTKEPFTYRSALYTLPLLSLCTDMLNNRVLHAQSGMQPVVQWARDHCRLFLSDSEANPLLFVEVLFSRNTKLLHTSVASHYGILSGAVSASQDTGSADKDGESVLVAAHREYTGAEILEDEPSVVSNLFQEQLAHMDRTGTGHTDSSASGPTESIPSRSSAANAAVSNAATNASTAPRVRVYGSCRDVSQILYLGEKVSTGAYLSHAPTAKAPKRLTIAQMQALEAEEEAVRAAEARNETMRAVFRAGELAEAEARERGRALGLTGDDLDGYAEEIRRQAEAESRLAMEKEQDALASFSDDEDKGATASVRAGKGKGRKAEKKAAAAKDPGKGKKRKSQCRGRNEGASSEEDLRGASGDESSVHDDSFDSDDSDSNSRSELDWDAMIAQEKANRGLQSSAVASSSIQESHLVVTEPTVAATEPLSIPEPLSTTASTPVTSKRSRKRLRGKRLTGPDGESDSESSVVGAPSSAVENNTTAHSPKRMRHSPEAVSSPIPGDIDAANVEQTSPKKLAGASEPHDSISWNSDEELDTPVGSPSKTLEPSGMPSSQPLSIDASPAEKLVRKKAGVIDDDDDE